MRLVSLKIIITAHSTAPDGVREVQNHGGSSDKCAAIVQLTIYIHGIFDEIEEKKSIFKYCSNVFNCKENSSTTFYFIQNL